MKLYEIIVYMLLVLLGVGCSDDDNFTLPVITPEASGTFTDERDGFEYHWVRVDGKDWMVENSHYKIDDQTKCRFYIDYAHSGEGTPEDKFSEKYGFLYTLQVA